MATRGHTYRGYLKHTLKQSLYSSEYRCCRLRQLTYHIVPDPLVSNIECTRVSLRYLTAYDDGLRPENHLLAEERAGSMDELEEKLGEWTPMLNEDKRNAVDQVWDSVRDRAGRLFFLQGAGGTGKTFVENYLLTKTRKEGMIALAVASSGIAAILLLGGRTTYSRLKLPIQIDESSTLNMSKSSMLADLLRETQLIIWDEAPMMHFHFAQALDLQDIRSENRSFGGITMVCTGDWRQALPVIPYAPPERIIKSTLQQASFWPWITTLRLSIHMRLHRHNLTEEARLDIAKFADWLKTV